MKKIISALLMLSMAIGGITFTAKTKDVQAATTIQSNRWYEGMTDGTNDQVYTYKMQASGYFYYKVIPSEGGYYYRDQYYESNSDSWVNTSMVKNYKVYVNNRRSYQSDGGYESPNYSFKAGDTVTIKVTDSAYYKTHYKIKVFFIKKKNFEKENNNSRSKANSLKKGVTYTGLAMDSDTDWYVFKAPKTKKYKIKAVCTNEGYCHQIVELYKGYKKKNTVYTYAGDGWKTVFSGKLKKGQKVYVKIYYGGDDEMYKIRVK